MRRSICRILRFRNIFIILLIIITILLLKSIKTLEPLTDFQTLHEPFKEKLDYIFKKKDYFVPASLQKMDWHNYKQIKYEASLKGIGEQGKPAHLEPKEAEVEKELYSVNGFNGALSDKISLNRSLPDIRHPGCQSKEYLSDLPTVSVVVPFHNEHWSTLLRTVYSVLNRSPQHLIKEIFLVDDASTKKFLKSDLDDYVKSKLPKVHIVRVPTRSGLITARLAGAKLATADVLIFLDSHTEANVNWLPPLLEPIALNYKTVMCPFIDVVAYDTFEYRAQDEGARGAFDWEFFYKRLPVLPRDTANMPEPFESPVMAGGLFAISRRFFWELGGYDPGLDIWGGEQYELSFKLWQCGGKMLDAPCSRVGHIYRKFAPFPNPQHGDFVGKNYRRVAEVWMDEYAEYLYKRRPHYRNIDPGDISEQKALRAKLKCKPFRWFITQIAFDLTAKYPPVEPSPYAEGKIQPEHNNNLCVDAARGKQMDEVRLTKCKSDAGSEQSFIFSWHKDVRSKSRNMCWDLPDSAPKKPVLLYSCHLGGGNQLWRYIPTKKHIMQGKHSHNCLDYNTSNNKLFINTCRDDSPTQKWNIDKVDYEMLKKWEDTVDRVTGPIEDY